MQVTFSRSKCLALLGSAVATAAFPSKARADASILDMLSRLFTKTLDPSWFSQLFLQTVGISKLQAGITALNQSLGTFNGVSYNGGAYFANYQVQRVPIFLELNASDQFDGLFLYPPTPLSQGETGLDVDALLNKLFTTSPVPTSLFSQRFLQQVPSTQIDSILAALTAQLGPFQVEQFTRGTHFGVYQKGKVALFVYVDPTGDIDALLFLQISKNG